MSYQLAGKRVRPKVFYYAYAPSIHSHSRCSRTGSDRKLKRSCRLGHSPFREAKTPKRVEVFFGFSKFWISAEKRRSCVISNAVFGALVKLLAPSKNLHMGGMVPRPPCQHATARDPRFWGPRVLFPKKMKTRSQKTRGPRKCGARKRGVPENVGPQ